MRTASPLPCEHEDLLTGELRRWAGQGFDRATANCGLSVLDYVERALGRAADPSPRGLSPSELACLWASEHAFAAYCALLMERLGCPSTQEPRRGDAGMVSLPGSGLTIALCLGQATIAAAASWAVRGAREVIVTSAAHRLAWRITCPRR